MDHRDAPSTIASFYAFISVSFLLIVAATMINVHTITKREERL